MLSENLKHLRKERGLSQEELAEQLHVVRQTVSKWEKGLSVPDSDMLIRLAEALGTTAAVLLGETLLPPEEEQETLRSLAARLELINGQFALRNERRRKLWRCVFAVIGVTAAVLLASDLFTLFHLRSLPSLPDSSSAIIGGADAPTSILVTSPQLHPIVAAIRAGLLTAAVFGFVRTRRK